MNRSVLPGLCVLAACAVLGPAAAGPTASEAQLDEQAYQDQRPHLLTGTPQAAILASISARIGRAAEKIYGEPFHYYLTAERDPDAYSYYGPRVYVSRGMVDFADSREELAGVLCHESSHVLHHDGTRTDRISGAYDSKIKRILHMRLLGKVAGAGEKLAELRYSRGEEEAADLSGATICSNAGSNPWGIVWMLRKLQRLAPSSGISWLSDHPSNKARIARLSKYLRANAVFAGWSDDPSLGSTSLRR